jgi:hypothetical protein
MQKTVLRLALITTITPLVAMNMMQMPNMRTWENMPMSQARSLLTEFCAKMGDAKGAKLTEDQLTKFETAVFRAFDSAPERIGVALNTLFPAFRRKLAEKPHFIRWCKKRMDTTGQFLAFMYRTNDTEKQKTSGITANRTQEEGMHTNMYMIDGQTFFTWTGSKKHGGYHGHGKWQRKGQGKGSRGHRGKSNSARPHPEEAMTEQN